MYIAIDVGGTNMRIALVDLSGEPTLEKIEKHRVPQDYSVGIEKLCAYIETLSNGKKIEGIGACFPGILTDDEKVMLPNNLPDWGMKPIKETISSRFKVPVKLLHDAQGAAIGEALFGVAKGRDRFVYFIWGTGIGAGDIKRIDNKRYYMFSFENGHHILDWDGKQCNCGQRGCPEAHLGGDRLREYFGEEMSKVSDDDPRWDFVVQKAAQVVLNTMIFHPTDLIVFNGGVISKRPFLLERIKPIMQDRLTMFPMPELALAALGDNSALYGCAGVFQIDLLN